VKKNNHRKVWWSTDRVVTINTTKERGEKMEKRGSQKGLQSKGEKELGDEGDGFLNGGRREPK